MSQFPSTLETLIHSRIKWLKVHHYSQETIEGNIHILNKFKAWCETRNL